VEYQQKEDNQIKRKGGSKMGRKKKKMKIPGKLPKIKTKKLKYKRAF